MKMESHTVRFKELTEFTFKFTSHVRDQMIDPNHLEHRQNIVWPPG